MRLVMLHPLVAFRSCADCKAWHYDEVTGEVTMWRGAKLKRTTKTPCELIVGCAKGSPDAGRELSEKNWQAYVHYRECRAVGSFPDDDTVRRNAAIIRAIEDEQQALRQMNQLRALSTIARTDQ